MRVLAWLAFANRAENPYNWLLYTHMAQYEVKVEEFSPGKVLKGKYEVWHLHWPGHLLDANPGFLKALLKTVVLLALICWARLSGTKVVWTVHDLHTHEGIHTNLEKLFWKAFTKQLDGYISLSKAGQEAALERFPALRTIPGFVIPHGHYREIYPDTVSRTEARSRLGISASAKVLLFLGLIRPYKNVPHLIQTFRQLPDPELVLVVAGGSNFPSLVDGVMEEASLDPRVHLRLGFVPDEEMQVYLRTADLVVLPYKEILNSGSALLALSFDRPVLVPRRGALEELQTQVGQEWVETYSGDLTARQLDAALNWALNDTRPERAPLENLGWDRLARQTADAYRTIAHHGGKEL